MAVHENGHGIFDGEHCRPVPPAPRGHAATGQQEPAAASRLVVRPACGPGSLPARIHEDGSDPRSPNRASGQKGGVAPVLLLSAGAVRVVRSRTKNPNNDGGKMDGGCCTPPFLFLVHAPYLRVPFSLPCALPCALPRSGLETGEHQIATSGVVSRTVGQRVKRSIAPRAVVLAGAPSGGWLTCRYR